MRLEMWLQPKSKGSLQEAGDRHNCDIAQVRCGCPSEEWLPRLELTWNSWAVGRERVEASGEAAQGH